MRLAAQIGSFWRELAVGQGWPADLQAVCRPALCL